MSPNALLGKHCDDSNLKLRFELLKSVKAAENPAFSQISIVSTCFFGGGCRWRVRRKIGAPVALGAL